MYSLINFSSVFFTVNLLLSFNILAQSNEFSCGSNPVRICTVDKRNNEEVTNGTQKAFICAMERGFYMSKTSRGEGEPTCSQVQILQDMLNQVYDSTAVGSRPFDGCGEEYKDKIRNMYERANIASGTPNSCGFELALGRNRNNSQEDE